MIIIVSVLDHIAAQTLLFTFARRGRYAQEACLHLETETLGLNTVSHR